MAKTSLLLLSFILALILSCERDDICPESIETTPRLNISFFNATNPNENNAKVVPLLRAVGIGRDTTAVVGIDGTTNINEIALPLRTTGEGDRITTEFVLTQNFGTATAISDTITINYNTQQLFINRGCGFKTAFTNVNVTLRINNNNWIKSIMPFEENQIIEDESTTHFKIFH